MILYKYMPYAAALAIAESNMIGFRQPRFFNDPFELLGSPETPHDSGSGELPGFRAAFKHMIWSSRTAALALTRAPLNSLMWAHYGDAHRGAVIGLDLSADEFTSEETNLVPLQHGSIIYTASRPTGQFLVGHKAMVSVGAEHSYRPDMHEMLQRLFLYKPSCWAYEEEVRVIKSLGGPTTFATVEVGGDPLHVISLRENAIHEVYLGTRCTDDIEPIKRALRGHGHQNVKLFRCRVSRKTWELEADAAG